MPITNEGKYLCNMDINFTLDQIAEAAKRFAAASSGYKVIAFHGSMGAGKTTFIHALCHELGVNDVVSSPTFSIINEYRNATGEPLFHLDLYRIKDEQEALDAGVEDCLFSGHTCLVEWPEKAPGIFPGNTLHAHLTTVDTNARKLQINL